MDSFKTQLTINDADLKNCNNLNNNYLNEIQSEKNVSFMCKAQLEKQNREISQLINEFQFNISIIKKYYEQNKSNAELELKNLESEFDAFEKNYNDVVQTSANNICCKNKIDNPDVDSFIIRNNKIVCTIGELNKIIC